MASWIRDLAATTALLLWVPVASAQLDLARAQVERLDNGLTVAVLEEPALPLVSVQMLYRVGAKHEPFGQTGLAHFLEHMAFRSSENFPDTEVVSSIYAVGGEWHGYTWLDQTTYFATVPRDDLDLLLRIEADRMQRLIIPSADVEAERGAVLSEMHGYENDPDTVLQDYVLYLSFLAHPYRNNTIGWESDVAGISHEELVAFYRQHYQPGNAILAVVGDVKREEVMTLVRRHFGSFAAAAATAEPRTVEPAQDGARHVDLRGAVAQPRFRIAWRAPSVHSPDFAAFLVAQDMLAGGSGVSFLQNDWGTPARPTSPLGSLQADISTWYPPSRQDYVLAVSGVLPDGMQRAVLEADVQAAMAGLAGRLAEGGDAVNAALAQARRRVERELLFDVQTTEDAAHQLAYFGGMDALPVLLTLPEAVAAVQAADVQRVITKWLAADRRTVGWMLPQSWEDSSQSNETTVLVGTENRIPADLAAYGDETAISSTLKYKDGQMSAGRVARLHNGVPVLLQPSPLSPTLMLKVVVPGAVLVEGANSVANDPMWGVTSLDFQLLPSELSQTVAGLPSLLAAAGDRSRQADSVAGPEQRLQQLFGDLLGRQEGPALARPLLVVLSGDFDEDGALRDLEASLGDVVPGSMPAPGPLNATAPMVLESALDAPVAQERLGYVARAPGPGEELAPAWWYALYILSHGYEGRLGKEAISRRGLVYYIDAEYGSNGRGGWVTLDIGVDPDKLDSMRALLQEELARMQREPPTEAEVAEAKQYLLGRFVTGAQSNDELASRLAREWLWYGELTDYAALRARLESVDREDVLGILPAFLAGGIVSVRYGEPESGSAVGLLRRD